MFTGSALCAQQQEKEPTDHVTRPPKYHSGLRVDHVTHLAMDLPPRFPNVGRNAQLRRLEQHQQQLEEIEQRREQHIRWAGRQMEEGKVVKNEKSQMEEEFKQKNRGEKSLLEGASEKKNGVEKSQLEEASEKKNREEKSQLEGASEQNREEKEREMEEQRRDLLHLQIQQQQQELKQRQQIMQWQQELEQQKKQSQDSLQKNLTTVLLSPSGLCTIYEALETSDPEEDFEDQIEEKEMVLKIKVEHDCTPKERSSIPEAGSSLNNPDSSQSQSTSPSFNLISNHEGLIHPVALDGPPLSGSSFPQQTSSLEFDWSKKADIVQQLINQTLLLNGDDCSPLLLLPGGTAGTLSPLETSLWPNLPPLTPPSATVTSVSSFSAEISGSSPQGEWTVVELETHH